MRHSLLVTCLLLTAWADPAGSRTDVKSSEFAAAGASVVEKTTDGRAPESEVVAAPTETSKQLIEFDEVATIAPAPKYDALDAVSDSFMAVSLEPVPMPPHRPVPHSEVCEALASAALSNDVPTPFLIRLIWQESGFRQNVVSSAGAEGVAQFMPGTAAERGLENPLNPLQAVRASAQLLRDLIQQFGNVGLAAAAYNAGPRRVQDWLKKRGKLPKETQDYVERITGRKADAWKAKTTMAAPLRVPERAPCQREAGLYAANGPDQIPLPPVLAKDQPVQTAKAAAPVTKTASAKSAPRPAKGEGKVATKDQSKIASDSSEKAPKVGTKSAAKANGKGAKTKVADAEAPQ